MKRKEFITGFTAKRASWIRAEVEAERMRASEEAMSMAELPDYAARLWRKHRKDYLRMTPEDLFK